MVYFHCILIVRQDRNKLNAACHAVVCQMPPKNVMREHSNSLVGSPTVLIPSFCDRFWCRNSREHKIMLIAFHLLMCFCLVKIQGIHEEYSWTKA